MATDIVNCVQLTPPPTDYSFMTMFIRIEFKWLNLHGMDLKCHIKCQMEYYKSIESSPAKEEICISFGGNIPSDDKFIEQFKDLYRSNKHRTEDSLITLLLKALVAKMAGKKVQNMMIKWMTPLS